METTIMENQMEKKMENEMEYIGVILTNLLTLSPDIAPKPPSRPL